MKRLTRACAAFALALGMLGVAAQAAVIHNVSDTWVWVTAYKNANHYILYSFCLAPGQNATLENGRVVVPAVPVMVPVHFGPYEIRAEVTHKDCRHPVMLDATLGFDGKTPYYIHGSNGKYVFRHTP